MALPLGMNCANGQVFWARGFLSNTSTGLGATWESVGGEAGGAWQAGGTVATEGSLSISANGSGEGLVWTGSGAGSTLDLSTRTDLHLMATLRLGLGNQCQRILIGLRSGPGNEKVWELPVSSFSDGEFRTVAVPVSAPHDSMTGAFNLAAVDRVILRVEEAPGVPTALQVERLALAEIPARGVVRIVGAPVGGDPYGAAYYPTIQRAVEASRPRDLVWVRPGIYHETVQLTKDYGLPETGLRIVADPSGPVILDGQAGLDTGNTFTGLGIGFDWSNTQNAATMVRANHILIEGFIVRNFVTMGFGNQNPGHVTIRHCVVHSNGSAGIGMNFPRADTRLRILSNVVFLNGWGEGWAGGIHINNKGFRLNSLAVDASGQQLPNDSDPGHEIVGNLSFLNLDESEYNSDGNGIMLDFGGGSEARITDNIVFFNSGGGLTNLNGRVTFERNIVYRNGWDPRAYPGYTPSNKEQIGFLIVHDPGVEPGITRDEFLHRTYPHFLASRLSNNLVRTASRLNFGGPYFEYQSDEQQKTCLAQFALNYGIWDLFTGALDTGKWWHVQYGYQLDPAHSDGNQFTDDQIGLVNPSNPAQSVQPVTRQPNLSETFPVSGDQVFVRQPDTGYAPPAIAHIFGHPFFQPDGSVTPFSEATESIGMVWNNAVKKNLSPKLATVIASRPPLDLSEYDFTVPDSAPGKFRACRPGISFAPGYKAVFENYLRGEFDGGNPACRLPYTFSPASDPVLPTSSPPSDSSWIQAEDLYSTALHRDAAIPRWRLGAAKDGPFGSPFLVSHDLTSLACLNRENALLARFTLGSAAAPILRFVLEAPSGGNSNNDSFFVRLVSVPDGNAVVLPLAGAYQVPASASASLPVLTSAGGGWYRVFFDQWSRQTFHLHLPLPELQPGTYEVQIQNRQRDVRFDRLGAWLEEGSQIGVPANPPSVDFGDWQSAHLPPGLVEDPVHLDPWADAGGLGVPNLLRVALGGATDEPTIPGLSAGIGTGGQREIRFAYNGLLAGISATVERSTDLTTWTPIASALPGERFVSHESEVAVAEGSGAIRTVSILSATSTPTEFWRLRLRK